MQTFIVAALAAVCTYAQEPTAVSDGYPVEEVDTFSVEDMFVLNEEGRYEFKGTDYDIPQVSFNDVDDQEIADYVQETEQRYVENDEKWVDAW